MDGASKQSQALTKFAGDHFYAKKKFLSLFSPKFYIYGPDEQDLRFFVKQKAFKLKEAIRVYESEQMQNEKLRIEARNVMDFAGTYDVETPEGEHVGALKREGLKSMFQDEWKILDSSDREVGKIQEDSAAMALMRRFLGGALIPQTFHVTVEGRQVGTLDQRFWPFSPRYDIDFSGNDGELDPRLGVAAIVLLLAIEGKQDGD
ncbi:MAG: hypothetical protein ABEL76_04035 [Bradymonadaceae bacterium]